MSISTIVLLSVCGLIGCLSLAGIYRDRIWFLRRRIWRLQGMEYNAKQQRYISRRFNFLTPVDNSLSRLERLLGCAQKGSV